jgi:hypothetical protein
MVTRIAMLIQSVIGTPNVGFIAHVSHLRTRTYSCISTHTFSQHETWCSVAVVLVSTQPFQLRATLDHCYYCLCNFTMADLLKKSVASLEETCPVSVLASWNSFRGHDVGGWDRKWEALSFIDDKPVDNIHLLVLNRIVLFVCILQFIYCKGIK